MGIFKNDKETTVIHRFGRDISEVWRFTGGAWRTVWQLIRSCFGRGFWSNNMPWSNSDGWKNQ